MMYFSNTRPLVSASGELTERSSKDHFGHYLEIWSESSLPEVDEYLPSERSDGIDSFEFLVHQLLVQRKSLAGS